MPIKVTCPKCQGVLHAPDDSGGKRGKCPTCGTVLAIPAEVPRSAPAPAPLPGPVEPAYRAPAAGDLDDSHRASGSDQKRSSFGASFTPPKLEPAPARGSMGKLPPPKPGDPFAKSGRPARPVGTTDSRARAYRRARGGLGIVQFALFLFLIAAVALPGIELAKHFKVPIPDKTPGYLGVTDLSAEQEIRYGAVLVPGLLGLLFLTLGRFGASNVPRSSYAKGPALASAAATLIGLLGLLALGAIVAKQVADGFAPKGMMLNDDTPGVIQRAGLAAALVFLPLAELWFFGFLGRLGAGLHSERAVGRHTRFVFLVGLITALFALAGLGSTIDPDTARDVRRSVDGLLNEQFAKLGDQQAVVRNGLCVLAGLVVWFLYVRLVGGGRRAIREWLDVNEPV